MIRSEEDCLQTSRLFPRHRWFRVAVHACKLTLGSLLVLSLVNCGGQDSSSVPSSNNIPAHQLTQEAYVKASIIGVGDEFGRVIAIEGNTLVVGAPLENGGGNNNSGAVYVFTRTGIGWTQQAYLKASNARSGDEFGTSVALQGDTLVVGAPLEDSGATDSGAVYVFTRANGQWTQQADVIKASNTGANDQFGFSVALSNDTLAVGALNEDSGATGVNGDQTSNSKSSSGAAYVFTRNNGGWAQQAYLKASNTDAGDQFGITVALEGDTLAVGAHKEDSNGSNEGNNNAKDSGAVYVFTRSAGSWAQEAYIKAPDTTFIPTINGTDTDDGDEFGRRVALSGDTLAVGAYREDSNGIGVNSGAESNNSVPDSGAVYVFTRSNGKWTQQAYIKASNARAHNRLGFAIALQGNTLVAGSSGEDSSSTGVGGDQFKNPEAWASGAAYVFTRTGSTWSQQAYVKASNTGGASAAQDSNGSELYGDQFGAAVALDGDTVVVGAYTEDSNGTESDNSASNSGAVYVLR